MSIMDLQADINQEVYAKARNLDTIIEGESILLDAMSLIANSGEEVPAEALRKIATDCLKARYDARFRH